MKTVNASIIALMILVGTACQITADSLVGSSKDTEIQNMGFVVDTTFIAGSSLYARGKVQNKGSARVTPPWYIEAQFYTDSTYVTKLGGNNTAINAPLDPNQQTFWTISYSSTQVDVRQFPKFRVKDIRAIYRN